MYQYRLKNYSVTAANIIVEAGFKRDTDDEALPNSAENISYPTGTTLERITADLEARAKSKVDTYENDLVIKEAAEANLDKWINVPVPK